MQKIKTLFIILAYFSTFLPHSKIAKITAQQPVYPIIFVHGLNGNDLTWQKTIEFFRDQFGWDDPYPEYQGIYHVVLNAYKDMTNIAGRDGQLGNFDDDVLFLIYDENDKRVNKLYPGNIFVINYHNFWNEKSNSALLKIHDSSSPGLFGESSSNESAIVKQGYALGKMIKKVLNVTGASKVILVGHSMGGLAAREYLQRRAPQNKIARWWAFPDEKDGHRVAKLVTIGTPHAGSNSADRAGWGGAIFGINPNSEAARDLTYNYSNSGPPSFTRNPDNGVYLFGGNESSISENDFHNRDIDCDGSSSSLIWGINSNTDIRHDNPNMPLPRNIDYTWLVSHWVGGAGDPYQRPPNDLAVRTDRQFLDNVGEVFNISSPHISLRLIPGQASNYRAIIHGLDEPDTHELAYEIEEDKAYHIFSTRQKRDVMTDVDWLRYTPNQSSAFMFVVHNAPVDNPEKPLQVTIYRQNNNALTLIAQKSASAYQSSLEIHGVNDEIGDILIRIETESTEDSWQYPMLVRWKNIGFASRLLLFTEATALSATEQEKTVLTAKILDSDGQVHPGGDNTVTFSIISGENSATFVGSSVVAAEAGIAKVELKALSTPGRVTVEANSEGLTSSRITINVYGSPVTVSKDITASTTWNLAGSPYRITKDISVARGTVLTIEAGTTILLEKNADIKILGGMIARGTPNNPIVFKGVSSSLEKRWGGIRFERGALNGQLIMENCIIRDAGIGGFNNNLAPINYPADLNPVLKNISLVNNRLNVILLDHGTYDTQVKLDIVGIPYCWYRDVTFSASSSLRINPGVLIKLDNHVDIHVNGKMRIQGTANDPIIFTSLQDDLFGGDSNNDGLSFGSPGAWGGLGISSQQELILKNTEFHFGGQGGHNTYSAPINLDITSNPSMHSIRLRNNRVNGILIVNNELLVTSTLKNAGVPYMLFRDLAIRQSADLSIEQGTVLKMWPQTDIYSYGRLHILGSKQAPVVITSYRDDRYGGDTNNDGSSTGVNNDFGGIALLSRNISSVINNIHIAHAGSRGYGNLAAPIEINPEAQIQLTGITFENCSPNAIKIRGGQYTNDIVIKKTNVPYYIDSDITVTSTGKLTIEPGVMIKLEPNADLICYTDFYAVGTETDSIFFTSYRDDSIGGDTNNDGKSRGQPGDWAGIFFSGENGKFSYFNARYGGSYGYKSKTDALLQVTSNLSVEKSSFAHSLDVGVFLSGDGKADFGGGEMGSSGYNQFIGFSAGEQNAFVNRTPNTIFAKSNYWGTNREEVIASKVFDRNDDTRFGQVIYDNFLLSEPIVVSVQTSEQPNDHDLILQNYPNPFNPSTQILFSIPYSAQVKLIIFDITGRRTRTLIQNMVAAGYHSISWDGTDNRGIPVASGTYYCVLTTPRSHKMIKMLLLR